MASFDETLTRMLARVSTARDKRQGSIIYDTLAPVAAELAQQSIVATIFQEQVSILSAVGVNLENLAANHGITRNQATRAIRIGEMADTDGNPIDLTIGSRFSVPALSGGQIFVLTERFEVTGRCLLECETAGTVGNTYLGPVLPLFTINNLGSAAITGTYTPGEDTETDEELRKRIIERINNRAFGGNVSDYKQFTTAIPGVGAAKIFPVWDGGGTVMVSIIDAEYNPATSEFIGVVQTAIDPVPNSGEGLGIAPIGHRVTVVTPDKLSINITASVNLQTGYTIGQLQSLIEDALLEYILEVRKQWSDSDGLSIFVARITSAIISLPGINNVTNVLINGSPMDLNIQQSPLSQRLPVLESVVIN